MKIKLLVPFSFASTTRPHSIPSCIRCLSKLPSLRMTSYTKSPFDAFTHEPSVIAEAPTTENLTERLHSGAVRHMLSVGRSP